MENKISIKRERWLLWKGLRNLKSKEIDTPEVINAKKPPKEDRKEPLKEEKKEPSKEDRKEPPVEIKEKRIPTIYKYTPAKRPTRKVSTTCKAYRNYPFRGKFGAECRLKARYLDQNKNKKAEFFATACGKKYKSLLKMSPLMKPKQEKPKPKLIPNQELSPSMKILVGSIGSLLENFIIPIETESRNVGLGGILIEDAIDYINRKVKLITQNFIVNYDDSKKTKHIVEFLKQLKVERSQALKLAIKALFWCKPQMKNESTIHFGNRVFLKAMSCLTLVCLGEDMNRRLIQEKFVWTLAHLVYLAGVSSEMKLFLSKKKTTSFMNALMYTNIVNILYEYPHLTPEDIDELEGFRQYKESYEGIFRSIHLWHRKI